MTAALDPSGSALLAWAVTAAVVAVPAVLMPRTRAGSRTAVQAARRPAPPNVACRPGNQSPPLAPRPGRHAAPARHAREEET